MSETIAFGAKFSVVGILIVFAALAVIVLAVASFRRLDSKWQNREKAHEEAALNKEQNIDSTTLVLISAAVATIFQGRYHIRSVRRLLPVNAPRSLWSTQGRAILHGSHVVSKKR